MAVPRTVIFPIFHCNSFQICFSFLNCCFSPSHSLPFYLSLFFLIFSIFLSLSLSSISFSQSSCLIFSWGTFPVLSPAAHQLWLPSALPKSHFSCAKRRQNSRLLFLRILKDAENKGIIEGFQLAKASKVQPSLDDFFFCPGWILFSPWLPVNISACV